MGLRNPAKLIPIDGGVRIVAPDGAVYDLKANGALSSGFIPTIYYKELSESVWESEYTDRSFDVYAIPVIRGGVFGVQIILEKKG